MIINQDRPNYISINPVHGRYQGTTNYVISGVLPVCPLQPLLPFSVPYLKRLWQPVDIRNWGFVAALQGRHGTVAHDRSLILFVVIEVLMGSRTQKGAACTVGSDSSIFIQRLHTVVNIRFGCAVARETD